MAKDLVEIYMAAGQVEATIVQSLLEAHGIPVMAVQESVGALYTISNSVLGEVRLLVPASHQALAEELIRDYEAAEEGNETASEDLGDEPEG
jgi:hypothetical protein